MRAKFGRGVVLCFLVLNGWGLWRGLELWRAHVAGLGMGPSLVSSPTGVRVEGKETLHWRWNAPVVGGEWVGRAPETPPVAFSPSIAGSFLWTSERELEFLPADPWPVGRRISAHLSATLPDPNGRVFAHRNHSVFLGPPLALLEARSAQPDPSGQLQTFLRFNAPVDPRQLREHLELGDHAGLPLEFELRETGLPTEFQLRSGLGDGAPLRLTLRPGLRALEAEDGMIPRETTHLLHPPGTFTLVGVESFQPTFGRGYIDLTFSSPPDLRHAAAAISTDPPAELTLDSPEGWWRRETLRVAGDFPPGSRITLRLASSLAGQNGQTLGTAVEHDVLIPSREPGLRFGAGDGSLLNAAGSRRVRIENEGEGELRLALWRVHDNNLVAYLHEPWWKGGLRDEGLSEPLWHRTIPLEDGGDVDLDLSGPLEAAGQGVYRLEVTGKNSGDTIRRGLTVGDVGLLARRQGGGDLLVWAVGLDDARPAAGLEVTLYGSTRQVIAEGRTDRDGLVILRGRSLAEEEAFHSVIARGEGRLGILVLDSPTAFPGDLPGRHYLASGSEAFVHTDRGIYRPGETLHAHAIVRLSGLALPGEHPVAWSLHGPGNLPLFSRTEVLGPLGTLSLDLPLDPSWPSGDLTLSLSLPGEDAPLLGATRFRVDSFVPPQVVAEALLPGSLPFAGPEFPVEVLGRMLYGGPAADHPVAARLTIAPELFRSQECPDHVFSDERKSAFSPLTSSLGQARLDAAGRAVFQVKVSPPAPVPSALRAVVAVTVTEFSGRPAHTVATSRVDLLPYYLGLRLTPRGEEGIGVDVAARRPDDTVLEEVRPLRVLLERLHIQTGYRRDSGGRFTWHREEVAVPVSESSLRLDGGHAVLPLEVPSGGTYRVTVEDPERGVAASRRIQLGGGGDEPERADRVRMLLEPASARPGDRVSLRLRTPFPGRLLLTMEDTDLLVSRVLEMDGRDGEILLEVPETRHPNLWLRAALLRPLPDGGAQPVLRADGAVPLRIDHSGHAADPSLDVASHLLPAAPAHLRVRGEPGAEVVVAAVDVGILRLTDFPMPDPFGWFTATRRPLSRSWDVFDDLLPEQGERLAAGDPAMGGGLGALLANRLNPVDAKRFRSMAWWSGPLRVPDNGVLEMEVPLAEFSGEIRWVAVQASATAVGAASATSRVGRGLVTQQSLPLFLAPGDHSRWTVRVHNRGSAVAELRVRLSVEGPVKALLGEQEPLRLAPGEVRILQNTVEAGPGLGVARCTAAFSVGEEHWEETIELGVRPVEARVSVAMRHLLAAGEELELPARDGAYHAFALERELRVNALPSGSVGAAVEYLLAYPYGCVEQTTSAGFPALVMPELIPGAAGGARERVRSTLLRLWGMQTPSGGFGYWSSRDDVSVVGSLHALEFLLEARAAGHAVDKDRLDAALEWTRRWLNRGRWSLEPGGRGDNRALAAAALVLAKAGRLDNGWAQRLLERRDDLHAGARVTAAEALAEAGHRPLALRMLEGVSALSDDGGWNSAATENARLLRALLRIDPTDGRIGPLVQAVLETRGERGRWRSTYENAAVLRALAAWQRTFPGPSEPPKVTWNGEEPPLRLPPESAGVLHNAGKRAVYVEEIVRGIPKEAPGRPNAFRVERALLEESGNRLESPLAGQPLLLRIDLSKLPRDSEYLVIDQRLPAGLEAAPVSRQCPEQPFAGARSGSRPRHVEVRDDRVLLFPNRLGPGDHTFYLRLNAVTPGAYLFPAAVVQDMYHEEFAARSGEGRVTVRDADL